MPKAAALSLGLCPRRPGCVTPLLLAVLLAHGLSRAPARCRWARLTFSTDTAAGLEAEANQGAAPQPPCAAGASAGLGAVAGRRAGPRCSLVWTAPVSQAKRLSAELAAVREAGAQAAQALQRAQTQNAELQEQLQRGAQELSDLAAVKDAR